MSCLFTLSRGVTEYESTSKNQFCSGQYLWVPCGDHDRRNGDHHHCPDHLPCLVHGSVLVGGGHTISPDLGDLPRSNLCLSPQRQHRDYGGTDDVPGKNTENPAYSRAPDLLLPVCSTALLRNSVLQQAGSHSGSAADQDEVYLYVSSHRTGCVYVSCSCCSVSLSPC